MAMTVAIMNLYMRGKVVNYLSIAPVERAIRLQQLQGYIQARLTASLFMLESCSME